MGRKTPTTCIPGRDASSNCSVSAKRLLSSALLVLASFGVEVAYAAPARATARVRALSCCSTRCGHAKSASAAAHCCGVGDAGSELAAAPETKAPESAPAMQTAPVEFDALSGLEGDKSGWANATPTVRARGAPLYLLTHSFRI